MTETLGVTWAVWRSRRASTPRDRAFAVYAALMVGVVVVAPVGRAAWIGLSSPAVLAALSAPAAASAWAVFGALVWIAAIFVGGARGPVVLSPFLAHAVLASAVPRRLALARPFVRAAAALSGVGLLGAGFVGVFLATQGVSSVGGALAFGMAGAAVGLIAAVLWLAGQTLGTRVSAGMIGALTAGMLASLVWPAAAAFTPWGWFGMLSPGAAATPWLLVPLLALAVLAVCAVPVLLDRLRGATVFAQSLRWDSARTIAYGLDLSGAAGLYRVDPRIGRGMRAVRALQPFELRILVRDFVGAARTPARLMMGCLGLLIAGSLVVLAMASPEFTIIAGAAAGVILYAGLGPLTDGVRHAAEASGALSPYGVGDGRLLAAHLLLPLLIGGLLVVAAAVSVTLMLAAGSWSAVLAGSAAAILCVIVRVSDSLKPPMPIGLLAPIPTPIGDPSSALRLAWAADAVIIAAAVGAAAVATVSTALPVVLASLAMAVLVGRRWSQR